MTPLNELQELWMSEPPKGSPESTRALIADEVLDYVRQESSRLDREISKRNRREYLAAVPLVVAFSVFSRFADHWLTEAGCYLAAASAVWIVFYLVRYGRSPSEPDPQQSLAGYREALRKKFDHQVQLLKAAKYWYILPVYVSLVLLYSGEILDDLHRKGHPGWINIILLTLTTVFTGWVWWLNEVRGVAKLREERDSLTRVLDDGERPPEDKK